jgi:hypothetical protein
MIDREGILDRYLLEYYRTNYKINATKSFLLCMFNSLEVEIRRITGLKFGNKLDFWDVPENEFYVKSDNISEMPRGLFINHNWRTYRIQWQSKSGRIYHPEDEVEDCTDLKFWFVDLDPVEIIQLMQPQDGLPFSTKKLGFEVEVQDLNMDMIINFHLKDGLEQPVTELFHAIDDYIGSFNQQSEQQDRALGVVHNWKHEQQGQVLYYQLDMGSAGMEFLAGLLKFCAKKKWFSKVVIGE